jgi:hypothetical protein
MKKFLIILSALIYFQSVIGCNQPTDGAPIKSHQFVIEREIPGAGRLTPDELRAASKKSCDVLRDLGPEIQWQHSYITADKVYCVYTAPNKEMIIEHAKRVGVPANLISEVSSIVTPATAQ